MFTIEIDDPKILTAMQWLDTNYRDAYEFESSWPRQSGKFHFQDATIAHFFALKWS